MSIEEVKPAWLQHRLHEIADDMEDCLEQSILVNNIVLADGRKAQVHLTITTIEENFFEGHLVASLPQCLTK